VVEGGLGRGTVYKLEGDKSPVELRSVTEFERRTGGFHVRIVEEAGGASQLALNAHRCIHAITNIFRLAPVILRDIQVAAFPNHIGDSAPLQYFHDFQHALTSDLGHRWHVLVRDSTPLIYLPPSKKIKAQLIVSTQRFRPIHPPA
jgi:hypothetical protein